MNETTYKIIKKEAKKVQALIEKMEYEQSLDRVDEFNEIIEEAIKLKGKACFDAYLKAFTIIDKHSDDTTLEKRALLRSLHREQMKIGEDIASYDYAQSLKKGFKKAFIVLLILITL